MCVVLETPIEGESTTEVVLGICQVFNICVRVCWWTPHVRDAVQEQVCGWHLNEGGGVPSKRGEGRKLGAPYLLFGMQSWNFTGTWSEMEMKHWALVSWCHCWELMDQNLNMSTRDAVNPTAGWSLIIFSGVSWHISDLSITPRYLLVV